MIMVGTMAVALWVIGIVMKAPYRARWTMLAILLIGVILIHLVLPDGHPLRMAMGEDGRFWALVIAFGFLVWGYRKFLAYIRARVAAPPLDRPVSDQFSNTELDRYARHIMLREIGGVGQSALRQSSVLVIGAGGLGASALQYLAAAGVGTIGVIDDDVVENANLQRQVIHNDADIGVPKVQSAAQAMTAQNPFVKVRPYERRLTAEIATELFQEYDLILDGSDNFETRYVVNRSAVATKKPLIAAAMTQWEGQISLYDPVNGAPCFACVFPDAPDPSLVPSCAAAGVVGPLPGVIGAMMALEAIKAIVGAGEGLHGRLLIYDALFAETRIFSIKARPDCTVCGSGALKAVS